jgi:hypothetical protein
MIRYASPRRLSYSGAHTLYGGSIVEPNVNEYCLVCKEYEVPLMQVKEKEFLCQPCSKAFGHTIFKPKKDLKKKDETSK